MKLESEGRAEIIDTYSNNTREWHESQMKYGGLKEELKSILC